MFAEIRALKLDLKIVQGYDVQLNELEKEIDELEAAGLDTDEKDADWDVLYQAQYVAYKDAVNLLKKLSGGKIDTATARRMLTEKQDELMALLNRAAA